MTGFGSGEDMPVLPIGEEALQAGDPGAAVRRGATRWGCRRPAVPRIRAAVKTVPGLASEAEALWYDPQRWPVWVDGFGHVVKLEGEWPAPGARAVWDSKPGGRGRVVERVTAYEARAGQTLEVEDESCGAPRRSPSSRARTASRSRSSSSTR